MTGPASSNLQPSAIYAQTLTKVNNSEWQDAKVEHHHLVKVESMKLLEYTGLLYVSSECTVR